MKLKLLLLSLAASLAVLTGCAGPQVSDYAAEQPALDLRRYFDGPIEAQELAPVAAPQHRKPRLSSRSCLCQPRA